eukprot:XP_001704404.1 Hypothetical protein GL50803_37900 [Giardia lamblia ATCC 50803]
MEPVYHAALQPRRHSKIVRRLALLKQWNRGLDNTALVQYLHYTGDTPFADVGNEKVKRQEGLETSYSAVHL